MWVCERVCVCACMCYGSHHQVQCKGVRVRGHMYLHHCIYSTTSEWSKGAFCGWSGWQDVCVLVVFLAFFFIANDHQDYLFQASKIKFDCLKLLTFSLRAAILDKLEKGESA